MTSSHTTPRYTPGQQQDQDQDRVGAGDGRKSTNLQVVDIMNLVENDPLNITDQICSLIGFQKSEQVQNCQSQRERCGPYTAYFSESL